MSNQGFWYAVKHPRDTRRYAMRWTGAPLSYLTDGMHMGSYRLKRDAQARCDAFNAERAAHD